MTNPDKMPAPDAGDDIANEIEAKLSRLPGQMLGVGNGDYVSSMIVDAASGRFSRLTVIGSALNPGEASIALMWSVPNLLGDSGEDFMSKLKGIEIHGTSGAPLSELAEERVGRAVARIRERIREN